MVTKRTCIGINLPSRLLDNVTWHPDGRFLAVYGRAGTIQILDPRVVVSSPPIGGGGEQQPTIGAFALGQQINAAANTEVYSILWDNYDQ
mmetsp:Transcript_16863/g.14070  ORF Transcript_16863/g.14070 Transcript_16863/m.14070 type:complete len:90 (-) Transcript_16863:25-294(-)